MTLNIFASLPGRSCRNIAGSNHRCIQLLPSPFGEGAGVRLPFLLAKCNQIVTTNRIGTNTDKRNQRNTKIKESFKEMFIHILFLSNFTILNRYTFANHLSRVSCNDTMIWYILCNHATSTNDNMASYFNTWKYNTINANYYIVSNICICFQASARIMRQNNCPPQYIAVVSDMYTFRIDICSCQALPSC